MKESWEVKSLNEIFEVKSSRRVHKADWRKEGVPFYRAREVVKLAQNGFVDNDLFISEELFQEFTKDKGAPKEGDIIISAVGTLGQCYLVKKDDRFYFKDASVLWFENISNVNPRYIEYAFKSDLVIQQVLHKSMGATVGTLTISRARKIQIPIPPLPEQKQIVAILDKAFAAIAQAQANIEKNIENAKELFQSKLNEIFSQKGDGWEERELLDVVTLKSGTTLPKSLEKTEGEIPYLKVSDMNIEGNEFEITTSTKFVNAKDIKEKNILPEGTIIFPKRGGAIATNKKRITSTPICIDLNTMGAIPKSDIYSEFLHFYFRSFDLMQIANGTTIPQINNYSFKSLKISLPKDKSIQNELVETLENFRVYLDETKFSYSKKLENLEDLKKSILQKAFSGALIQKSVAV